MEHALDVIAGIAWDPHLRGVFTVLAGVLILAGSIYLVLGTDLGFRLGFLVAVGGFFGWMFILSLTWWISPPAIGPRGDLPEWVPRDVVEDLDASSVDAARDLPSRDDLPDPAELIDADPELFEGFDDDATLSELAVAGPDALDDLALGGWRIVPAAEAGEVQAAADAVLAGDDGLFDDPSEYLVLDSFEVGGKPTRDDDELVSRVLHKISSSARLTNPTHYAIVQVQAVQDVEVEPGEAPPPLEVDPDAPVISVVMIRELGNLRVPPAMVTVGSLTILLVIAYALHRRDKLALQHRALVDETAEGAG